jgi:MoaA/NifB/PqqE/SkfB family radical SAM enzyme
MAVIRLFRKSGVQFSGGELFVREDIFEILSFTKQRGLYTVVISNGWLVDMERTFRGN